MLYVYRRRNSTGARDLVEGLLLAGTHARRTKGDRLRTLQVGDTVICWGDHFVAPAGIRTLNNVAPISKFREAQVLREKQIPTIQVSQTRPAAATARPATRPAFVENAFTVPAALLRQNLSNAQVEDLYTQLDTFRRNESARRQQWANAPLPPAQPTEVWLARRNNHVGGNDLLNNITDPDFYSKKEDIVEEYRIHTFRGKSVRAGKKIQRPTNPNGGPSHPWIRSFDAGWIISYDGFQSTKPMRDLASKAVKALGLDFAAVDIGKLRNGSFIVLEVNRAPGIEGNTITAYAKHVAAWLSGRTEQEED